MSPTPAPPPSPASPSTARPGEALPTAARWRLRLLGDCRIEDGRDGDAGRSGPRWPSRAAALLLARLALAPERAHPREELIELLWPGVDLDTGRNRLRQCLSSLRAVLEPPADVPAPVLIADRQALRLVPGAVQCDALDFDRCVRTGRLDEARALYRGELLPGHYDDWIDDERLRLQALHDRLGDGLPASAPRAPGAIPTAPAAAPTDERASVSPRADDPPAPGSALVSALGPALGAASVPTYLTRLFGADAQAARLRETVAAERLVTLIGPGGTGKTRLAVELARWLQREPPVTGAPRFDLVAFAPLVRCTQPGEVLAALLAVLRIGADRDDPLERLVGRLDGRRSLLVLDNFEQLVDSAGGLVATLAARLPQLHLVLTSRRRLGLDGEHSFAVETLALPEPSRPWAEAAASPAVALFVDRARAVRSDFHLGARNAADLVALVRVLEGMPLAIELAASRVRSLSPAEMLARLQRPVAPATHEPIGSAHAGLDLLARSGVRAGHDPRHASMLRVIEWSWQLLSAPQARLMGALTAFHGGCSADAVAWVWAAPGRPAPPEAPQDDAMLLLDDLVGHSMVQARALGDGPLRFSLFEPIREYAASRLDDADARQWRARHRAWLLHWAATLPATPPLDEIRREMPNLLGGLASAVADDAPGDAVQLMLRLRRTHEDVQLPDRALDLLDAAVRRCQDPALRDAGAATLGPLLLAGGRPTAALEHVEAALAACPPEAPWRGRVLHAVVRVRWRSTRRADGLLGLLDEADAIAARTQDRELQAGLWAIRAFIVNHGPQRDRAAGEALHRQALASWEALGNEHAMNSGRYNLAVCAQLARRNDEVLERLADIEHSARTQHDWHRLSQALNVRGIALGDLRRWRDAVATLRDCIRLAWQTATPHDLAYGLWNLPRALAHAREPVLAARLAAYAGEYWAQRMGPLSDEDHRDLRRVERLCRVQCGADSTRRHWDAGRRLSLAEAVALALGDAAPGLA